MFAKGQAVAQLIEELAPKRLAVPDDKIGLQLGSLQKEIRKVVVALDVTEAVAEEAIREKADLIVAHHAIIFRPLAHLQTDTPAGRVYEQLIKHDIAVYIAHTNLDVADGGINDWLAEPLGLTGLSVLEEVYVEKLRKIVVFVPDSHLDAVRQAMFHAGAGHIGAYSHCSFGVSGTGTFLPGAGSSPFVGTPGRLELAPEIRLETIVPESAEKRVVQAMRKAHPYEEMVCDVYPTELKGRSFGLGRVGRLPEAVPLQQLAEAVKKAYGVPAVRLTGDPAREVRKVAVLGGQGGKYVRHALFAGADVLITGDIDYHTAQDAMAAGLALIDPGHNIEKVMKSRLADYLNRRFTDNKYETAAVPSAIDTEVFRFL